MTSGVLASGDGDRRDRGFALLLVLWTMVLLSLIGTRIAASGRAEAQRAANLRDAAVTEAAADGAVQEVAFHLLDGPPIAMENSDVDLTRQHATVEVRRALRELATNLLRVIRGAGKPHEILQQAHALLEALASYHETVGAGLPAEELSSFLAVDRDPELLEQVKDRELARFYAEERVIQGALQVVASRLIGQKTHERDGEREMWTGIDAIEVARAERRKAMIAPPPLRPRKPKTRDS